MGTRNLVAVVKDGDFKVAQYGQWDGYPEGQGVTVLAFLQNKLETGTLDAFAAKVARCHWITDEEAGKTEDVPNWAKVYPHLSRDTGGTILELIDKSEAGLALADSRSFAGDSLFCEWAYVVDLDHRTLEVYQGFNKTPTPADSRFPSGASWLEEHDKTPKEYEPIRLLHTFSFDDLAKLDDKTFATGLYALADGQAVDWAAQMDALVKSVGAQAGVVVTG